MDIHKAFIIYMPKPTYYEAVTASPDFPALEKTMLQQWKIRQTFEHSVQDRPAHSADGANNEYVFYDGPPFANGLPHYGHLLTGFVKDIFARYHTMLGQRVERRFGWDCHGLPAEMGAEKELGISGRHAIAHYGIDRFNDHCRQSVMKYAGEWEAYVERQGRWVDFKQDYKTMDVGYMESVLWAFKQLYDKGWVYQSMRVVPYSWACQTPLSNFETRMDNAYRERADKAVTVAFKLKGNIPEALPKGCTEYRILAWTTTPWTLPSNLALGVHKNLPYTLVIKEVEGVGKVCYVLAAFAVSKYLKELGLETADDLKTILGEALLDLMYEPLFPYFKDHANSFKILHGDFITEGDGTGVVHLAPGFGEDDMAVCQAEGIELVCPVDNAGKFIAPVTDFEGIQVFDANDEIIKRLKRDGNWIKTEQYLHSYPHCWRTDTPLIYKAVPSWYVKVTAFKDRMVELNQQINWIPEHVKDGQFGKWLENARDWSISRNRFWGAPIPVWYSDNPENNNYYVFGSIAELETFFGVTITDLHRPYIDQLTKPDPLNPAYTLRRVEDVFDCWFESGSMPYAQVHYPFENREWFETHFPADFIVEYAAQTRGWFYTLMVLSTALFDRPPFKNCICHGVVLDDKGQKLSKRLNNYADPMAVFDTYGADAMRWVMVSAPIMQGGELLIDKEGNMIRDAVRLVLKPIWNSYHFFTLYANADGIKANVSVSSTHPMDQYILAKCKGSILQVKQAMDSYNTPAACKVIEAFYEVLNNWYIRRSKERYWKSEPDADKQAAYDTLYTVQHLMIRALSPLLPFLAETVYQGLAGGNDSVHLQAFPDTASIPDAPDLVMAMDKVREVCNTGLSIRNAQNIRVRQPLSTLTIVAPEAGALEAYHAIIQDELNVKDIIYQSDVLEHATYALKINFPILGKRLPHKMKDVISASKQGKWTKLPSGNIEVAGEALELSEYELTLLPKQTATGNGAQALQSNDALVMLDLVLTPALKQEGIARDMVRFIQQSRKEADLHVSDRIELAVASANQDIQTAVTGFKAYIGQQTLAVSVEVKPIENYVHQFTQTLEGAEVSIGFSRAA